jgi:hypothetical protein
LDFVPDYWINLLSPDMLKEDDFDKMITYSGGVLTPSEFS